MDHLPDASQIFLFGRDRRLTTLWALEFIFHGTMLVSVKIISAPVSAPYSSIAMAVDTLTYAMTQAIVPVMG
jgi:hypothetical protein